MKLLLFLALLSAYPAPDSVSPCPKVQSALFFDIAEDAPFSGELLPLLLSPGFAGKIGKDQRMYYPKGGMWSWPKIIYNHVTASQRFDVPMIPNGTMLAKLDPAPAEGNLSPFGRALFDHLQGRTFYDLGSGNPNISVMPRAIAQRLGAREYVGVDATHAAQEKSNEYPDITPGKPFQSRFVKSDMVDFLKGLDPQSPKFFYLEGLEVLNERGVPDPKKMEAAHAYLKGVMRELQRATRPGDAVLIGRVVSLLHPPEEAMSDKWRHLSINPADYGFERVAKGESPTMEHPENTVHSDASLWRRLP